MVSVRLEPELMDRISRAAEAEHRSVSNYIRHVLMEHLPPKGLVVTERLDLAKAMED
jgi:hypothetical protein